ncbi:MAG: YaaR family protein [Caulobacteraceae bacterium]
MKIADIKSSQTAVSNTILREDRKIDFSNNKSTFGDTLKKTEEQNLETRLGKLMSEIEKQGEQLSKTMDVKELKNYKKLISDFMNEVVNNALKFSKQSNFDRRGRHKVYAIVRKVNAKVEELSREVLKEEKDNIKILESIGSIRGMLLDMYM